MHSAVEVTEVVIADIVAIAVEVIVAVVITENMVIADMGVIITDMAVTMDTDTAITTATVRTPDMATAGHTTILTMGTASRASGHSATEIRGYTIIKQFAGELLFLTFRRKNVLGGFALRIKDN